MKDFRPVFRYFLDTNSKKALRLCFFRFFSLFFFIVFGNLKQYSIKERMWNCKEYYLGDLNQQRLGIRKIDFFFRNSKPRDRYTIKPRRGYQNV